MYFFKKTPYNSNLYKAYCHLHVVLQFPQLIMFIQKDFPNNIPNKSDVRFSF